MIKTRRLIFQLSFLTIQALLATACQHAQISPNLPMPHKEDALLVHSYDNKTLSVRSRWIDANRDLSQGATVIMVPGSGNHPLEDPQSGNGIATYSQTYELGSIWQEYFARAGYNVFAYDKRALANSPSDLAVDLDSACAAVIRRFGKNQKIVLWTSEQGTQVVLSSNCKNQAAAIVIVSPIPEAIDSLWTSGLREAGLLDRARSLNATFEAIHNGLFEPDAKIMGASVDFWKNWLELSKKSFKQLEDLKTPILFVLGEKDMLVGRFGRSSLEKLSRGSKNKRLLIIPNTDRNLLQKESLSQTSKETILQTLSKLVDKNG